MIDLWVANTHLDDPFHLSSDGERQFGFDNKHIIEIYLHSDCSAYSLCHYYSLIVMKRASQRRETHCRRANWPDGSISHMNSISSADTSGSMDERAVPHVHVTP